MIICRARCLNCKGDIPGAKPYAPSRFSSLWFQWSLDKTLEQIYLLCETGTTSLYCLKPVGSFPGNGISQQAYSLWKWPRNLGELNTITVSSIYTCLILGWHFSLFISTHCLRWRPASFLCHHTFPVYRNQFFSECSLLKKKKKKKAPPGGLLSHLISKPAHAMPL